VKRWGRNNIAFIIIGLIALILGIAIKLFAGRRRFYTRNQAGLQGFKNYRSAIGVSSIERILTFLGGVLIVTGIISLAVALLVEK
jgi:hypothetical protein